MYPSSSPSFPLGDLSGLKLLVVEDDAGCSALLRFVLEHAGAEVRFALSIIETLSILSEFTPDAILSDFYLLDGNGYSLLAQLRSYLAQTERWQIPVVAISASPQEEWQTEDVQEEFQACLMKPLNLKEVVDVVSRVTHRSAA